jgi:hypothetical protein
MVFAGLSNIFTFSFRPADLILSGDPYLEYAAQISLSARSFVFLTILALPCSLLDPEPLILILMTEP